MKPRNCQSVSHEVKNEMMKEIVEFLVEKDSNESSTKIEEIVKIFDQARKSQNEDLAEFLQKADDRNDPKRWKPRIFEQTSPYFWAKSL